MQKTGIFFVIILFFGVSTVFAEEYYYMEGLPPLTSPPTFCAVRFSDPNIPDADEKIYEATRNAVLDWKNKLIQYTGNVQGWDFNFKLVYPVDGDANYAMLGCDVPIFFTTDYYFEEVGHRGVTQPWTQGYSTITISYIPVLIDEELIKDHSKVAPDVDFVIKHEIGHALRLDHPNFNANDFKYLSETNELSPPSIMWSPAYLNYEIAEKLSRDIARDDSSSFENSDVSERIFLENYKKIQNLPLSDEITDYDLRSLVNLYGMDGINELPSDYDEKIQSLIQENTGPTSPDIPELPVFIAIIIVILAAIVYFTKKRQSKSSMYVSRNKRSSSKVSTQTTVDTTLENGSKNNSKSKKCPHCGRRLSNYDKPRPCGNCGNMV